MRDFHATTAAAGSRFDQYGETHIAAQHNRIIDIFHFAVGARHNRNAQFNGFRFGGNFVAHHADMFGSRADKADIMLVKNIDEFGVFRQKAIARMHRIGYRLFRKLQQWQE